MPTIKYPKNPNVETAFVEQYDGTKNRVVMTAPQDISTLEYPSNPNSTKGYVTVNGKKQRVIMVADIAGGGGGGAVTSVNGKTGDVVLTAKDVDALAQFDTMPTANASNSGDIVQFIGTTDANYTNGYFYKATGTTTYTGTVSFDPASISGTTATCSGDDFAELVAEYGTGNITDIIKGTLTYDLAGGLLVFVGLDDTDTQVCTFQLYTQDYTDAGFVFTGTLADGDVIAFTTTISESTTYSWNRIDVQPAPDPLPSQTGNNGKFLSTNGTTASWSDKPLVNTATVTNSLTIGGVASTFTSVTNIGLLSQAYGYDNTLIGHNTSGYRTSIAIGSGAFAGNDSYKKLGTVAIGYVSRTRGDYSVAIGNGAKADADGAIQISATSISANQKNSDANTFKVGNANGNFEIMDANGNLPADRLASTTGLADGNYRLRLVMSNGTPTLTWVAE